MDVKIDEMVQSMRVQCEQHGLIKPYAILCSPKAYWKLMESPHIHLNYEGTTMIIYDMNIYVESWVPDWHLIVSDEEQIQNIIRQIERGYEVPELKPHIPKPKRKYCKKYQYYGQAAMSDNAVCYVTLTEPEENGKSVKLEDG